MIDVRCALVRSDKTEREHFIDWLTSFLADPKNHRLSPDQLAWAAYQERGKAEQAKEVANAI